MKVPSQDLTKYMRLFAATLLLALATLATASKVHAAPTPANTAEISPHAIDVSIVDLFILPLTQFLNANGNVTPAYNAYFPEHGDPGYLDTYYGKVDPQGKRTTLAAWKEENDFNDYPSLVKKAEYINAADLGFGRKMHCIDNGRTSCYVDNYLDPKGSSDFAATVAMERMSNNYGMFVAYFVFDSEGNRINQIPLDSEGPKSVPQSCWACHGGYGHGSTFFGGNYLPFDVNALEDWPGHPTRASQVEQFRSLNYIVWRDAEYLANNENLTDLIEKWYGGAPFSGTTYKNAAAPSSWVTNPSGALSQNAGVYKKHKVETYLYQDVYGKYCRMCHVAQDLDWQDAHAADFALAASNHLCNDAANFPAMPHAEVTYNDFFNSAQHKMPSLNPLSLTANPALVGSFVNPDLSVAGQNRLTAELQDPALASVGDLALAPKYTGHQMLCEKLPLNIPAGNKNSGSTLFSSKGCAGCHYVGTYQNKIGGDLECRGAWLRQNMGSVDPAMNGVSLSLQQIQNIALYLNDRPACK